MANGDRILDDDGNVLLDDDGNVILQGDVSCQIVRAYLCEPIDDEEPATTFWYRLADVDVTKVYKLGSRCIHFPNPPVCCPIPAGQTLIATEDVGVSYATCEICKGEEDGDLPCCKVETCCWQEYDRAYISFKKTKCETQDPSVGPFGTTTREGVRANILAELKNCPAFSGDTIGQGLRPGSGQTLGDGYLGTPSGEGGCEVWHDYSPTRASAIASMANDHQWSVVGGISGVDGFSLMIDGDCDGCTYSYSSSTTIGGITGEESLEVSVVVLRGSKTCRYDPSEDKCDPVEEDI